jgi:hypothetical protein
MWRRNMAESLWNRRSLRKIEHECPECGSEIDPANYCLWPEAAVPS